MKTIKRYILNFFIFASILIGACIWADQARADVYAQSATPVQSILITSSAKTTTQTVKIYTPAGLKCGHIIINVSAYTLGNLTPHIQAYDAGANAYYDILVGAAISATGRTTLRVCPGLTAAANLTVNDFLPLNWQLSIVAGTADSITYSATAELLP